MGSETKDFGNAAAKLLAKHAAKRQLAQEKIVATEEVAVITPITLEPMSQGMRITILGSCAALGFLILFFLPVGELGPVFNWLLGIAAGLLIGWIMVKD